MFSLTDSAIDSSALAASLETPEAGALVTFEGRVRNHHQGRPVERLEYEAFGNMAEREGHRILTDACARFDIHGARVVHRTGTLAIGDCAVWVGVVSSHRAAAFDACRWIMDRIKEDVPIWKKEHYSDGTPSEWVLGTMPPQ